MEREENGGLMSMGEKSLHRTNFKAPKKLYAEKRSIRPFSVM
jgi:hypothetical protein